MDFDYLTPCPTEDSTDCYWVGDSHGNGTGTSFVNIHGVQYTLDTPTHHTIESVVAFADGTPGVAYQEMDIAPAYDLTLPVVIVAAALAASVIALAVGFFRRAR